MSSPAKIAKALDKAIDAAEKLLSTLEPGDFVPADMDEPIEEDDDWDVDALADDCFEDEEEKPKKKKKPGKMSK